MMLAWLLFWAVLVGGLGAGVWWLVRHGVRDSRPSPGRAWAEADDPAAEILRERFARGEIDREEFEERQRVLSG